MNKEEVSALIEKLADKTLEDECVVRHIGRIGGPETFCPYRVEILGNHILHVDMIRILATAAHTTDTD